MKRTITLAALFMLLAVCASAQVQGDTLTLQGPSPSGAQQISATAVGANGSTNLYYMVATRYPQGLVLSGPVLAASTLGIANLDGTNYVQVGWQAANGATGYYVVRGTTPTFLSTGACTSCVVVANTTATTFSDQGGATTNYPPAGVPNAGAATFNMILDNTSESLPYLRTLLNGVSGRIPIQSAITNLTDVGTGIVADDGALFESDESQYRWRTESDIFIGGLASAYLDWSARTGSVFGFGTRLEADFATVTALKGTDTRVQSTGGALSPAGQLMGAQSAAFQGVGTTSIGEVYGGNHVVLHQDGASVNVFGSVGSIAYSGGSTGGSLFNVGAYGEIDDSSTGGIRVAGTNFTAALLGVVNNSGATTRAVDAGVISMLTAGNPQAAFMAVDRNATAGVNFDFGLDLYGTTTLNSFTTADIRGQARDLITNSATGLWRISRGTGDFTGAQIEATALADLGTPPDGTQAYCSDCDPVSGTMAACTSAGGASGAWAFRINGNWDCASR